MPLQFAHPEWLLGTAVAVAWVVWLAWRSDSSLVGWRRHAVAVTRFVVTLALGLALAGAQYRMPVEGINVFHVLDRSDSIPPEQQEAARELVNTLSTEKRSLDKGGVVVFGADAAIEAGVGSSVDLPRVQAVVPTAGTDLAGAIRLATAAFPESGQRRVVLYTDGNETSGDAMQAVVAARPLGVSVDVVPLGAQRGQDILIQKVTMPNKLKKGQTFDVKIFAHSDKATRANVSLYRNDQLLGTQPVDLLPGKNLFTFPQTLTDAGFYGYDVRLDAPGDAVAQNNRSTSFTHVRGEPRVLVVSSDPKADQPLAAALREAKLEVTVKDVNGFPATLAEMQSYDEIFLSNVAAGDLSTDLMRLLQGAVRDFGVGLVVLGGDQAFAAGGYRGTPLEETLPVDMELSSKKVLPKGAIVLVVHATEFPNGNQWARDIAFAALQALGPQDEMGIVLWDGSDRWLFPLGTVGDRRAMGRSIMGMNPGDMPQFQHVMEMAHEALKKSTANLKHMVVFSDGDPGAPSAELVQAIVGDRITISTVMIGGHVEPSTMMDMAEKGSGRFYDVMSPASLPQIFVKETAVILKAAIIENPFRPQLEAISEVVRGIGAAEYPELKGYVATMPKPRAETPLVTDKGDPLLAHWQMGLGRAVAFTSDARTKWAANWVSWGRYQQFWTQVAQWALRKVEASDFNSEVSIEGGEGHVHVEALNPDGSFRNFLNLQAVVLDPKGNRQTVNLEQKGPGRYEARFAGKEVGSYMINLLNRVNGEVSGVQTLGASLNYSPEFNAAEPNLALLKRLAEVGGGRVLDPANRQDNPYLHDRVKTHQPRDLWWYLLMTAVVLFPLDVGLRRVQIDREEWARVWALLMARLGWRRRRAATASQESMATLLARKEQVRSQQTAAGTAAPMAATPSVAPPTPSPDLFRPAREVVVGDEGSGSKAKPSEPPKAGNEGAGGKPTEAPESGTSRLLEAKRRARKKL